MSNQWQDAWARLESATVPSSPRLRPSAEVREAALRARGFLLEEEGETLFNLAVEMAARAPSVEIGSYCGKSALYLAAGCRQAGGYPLFTVDHHRGNAEQQPGQEYFDPALFDQHRGRVDTLPHLLETVRQAGLEEWVIPLVADSAVAGRAWPPGSLSLVFIDGGHSVDDVATDVRGFAPKLMSGGYLCMHDLFASPLDGGQAPYHAFEALQRSGEFVFAGQTKTLGTLRRK